ncbi:MAG: aminotransferase class V-fold PLP-dependent enzyme [Spirochaetes bacterium]|nr:aminotransferase class V-fold PLP-dependent enzyme [Spirochaetota bacterium]
MSKIYPTVDPDGLLEYSVVFTDRSLNHMSQSFQQVMRDIHSTLNKVYQSETVIIVPGSGTYGMEAVARQYATGKKCLVIQNGLFSFRWSQIFETGNIPASWSVLKAEPVESGSQAAYAPCPIEKAVKAIKNEKPDVVFAPHVETSAGMVLPDDYLKAISDAVHSVGGIFVLDCIASGTIWIDMKALGVDVLISAPQKGWSGTPCCGIIMLGPEGLKRMEQTQSNSFAIDLKKWYGIMQAYVDGGHAYHATMPTDSLKFFRDIMKETEAIGFEKVRKSQIELGEKVRALMTSKGIKILAAPGYEAPGVVVAYHNDAAVAKKFIAENVQIAAGVPIKCDEPADFQTFRIGLFGLDKLQNVDRTVDTFKKVLEKIF